jgi:hypothetical protein
MNDGGQPSSLAAATGDDNANRDYITMDDLLQDMADNDGGGDGEPADVLQPKDAELFEDLVNRLDHDDVLFGNPKRLENFREMKQVVIDPLYKDCPKHWTMLHFNL